MSAIFEVELMEGIYVVGNFTVEITHDLNLSFLNYDIEYDITMMEFGEEKTPAIRFLDLWKVNPQNAVSNFFKIPENIRNQMACDWAEHVLPIFEERTTRRYKLVPLTAIQAKRKYNIDQLSLAKLRVHQKKLLTAYKHAEGYAAEAAAMSATYAVGTPTDWDFVSERAVAAAAWYEPDPSVFPDLKIRSARAEQEKLWQVRRLVDVMEALQSKKRWPTLEDTK